MKAASRVLILGLVSCAGFYRLDGFGDDARERVSGFLASACTSRLPSPVGREASVASSLSSDTTASELTSE
jgi:hypothetical protein